MNYCRCTALPLAAALACFQATTTAAQVARATPAPKSRQHLATAPRLWRDRLTGRRYPLPAVIGGRPVAFYLASRKVSPLAKALYTARFQPSDTDSTSQLLALVTTNDSEIRPFYRWCLDFTISLSDGALGEYPGPPALAYATKFPREFFAYMDKDASDQRYKRWVELMAYSGLNEYAQPPAVSTKAIEAKITRNCPVCSTQLARRIHRLAADIVAVATRND